MDLAAAAAWLVACLPLPLLAPLLGSWMLLDLAAAAAWLVACLLLPLLAPLLGSWMLLDLAAAAAWLVACFRLPLLASLAASLDAVVGLRCSCSVACGGMLASAVAGSPAGIVDAVLDFAAAAVWLVACLPLPLLAPLPGSWMLLEEGPLGAGSMAQAARVGLTSGLPVDSMAWLLPGSVAQLTSGLPASMAQRSVAPWLTSGLPGSMALLGSVAGLTSGFPGSMAQWRGSVAPGLTSGLPAWMARLRSVALVGLTSGLLGSLAQLGSVAQARLTSGLPASMLWPGSVAPAELTSGLPGSMARRGSVARGLTSGLPGSGSVAHGLTSGLPAVSSGLLLRSPTEVHHCCFGLGLGSGLPHSPSRQQIFWPWRAKLRGPPFGAAAALPGWPLHEGA